MSLWRTLRRWNDQYWFEIVLAAVLLLIAGIVILFVVLIVRSP